MKYNHYNEYYANKIDEIYLKNNFNNIEYYIEILELIYKIYYNENILVVIDKNIKYNLNSFIELFLNNPKIIYNDFDNSIKNIIDLIEVINNVTNFSNNYYIDT
jgi:hypothetical protein